MTTTAILDCPTPGVRLDAIPGYNGPLNASIVLASGVHIDEGPDERDMVVYGVLVLNSQDPFYTVLELVSRDFETVTEVIDLGTEGNIVPAVHVFHANFGFWGGGALTDLGNESPHE